MPMMGMGMQGQYMKPNFKNMKLDHTKDETKEGAHAMHEQGDQSQQMHPQQGQATTSSGNFNIFYFMQYLYNRVIWK